MTAYETLAIDFPSEPIAPATPSPITGSDGRVAS